MTKELKVDVETLSVILKDLPDEKKIEKAFLLGISHGVNLAKDLVLVDDENKST